MIHYHGTPVWPQNAAATLLASRHGFCSFAYPDDRLISRCLCAEHMHGGVPVWHLHESLERLADLINSAQAGIYGRVAFGSSGEWATIGTEAWWSRMDEVREVACDEAGRPKCKFHGLRMLAPTVFSHVPLASADSCNVALNVGKDKKWKGTYQPLSAQMRALVLAERIERHAAASTWSRRRGVQANEELLG